MTAAAALEKGRAAFAAKQWTEAFTEISEAVSGGDTRPEDLELLATSAFLIGRDDASVDSWTRAHHQYVTDGNLPRAVRCAFWIGFVFMNRAQMAPAMGWFGRAQKLIEECGDCVEQGYVLLPLAIGTVDSDPAAARDMFIQIAGIGARFGEPDLVALGTVGRGRALMRMGSIGEGASFLDEAMVSVTAEEVSSVIAGQAYCVVLEGCFEVYDLKRATEWTAALTRWCESQPDLVPFRGQCLVHRAELMQRRGAWSDAIETATSACDRLGEHPMVGNAYYQLGELHRLRGEAAQAEAAYTKASATGREPQPGLSLLRLAEGKADAAEAAMRRVLETTTDPMNRAAQLAAFVDVMLACGNVADAREAADELTTIAASSGTPFLGANASLASGCVLLAMGDVRGALEALGEARAGFTDLDVPFECARVRVQIARAYRELGDGDAANMEEDAARRTFEQLGAMTDLRSMAVAKGPAGGLTGREVEVLRLVATGKTNRAIASELVLSEKTVARHLSNIFTKLGLSSRAAATAYAYEHQLV